MQPAVGTRLGTYEIVAPLGAGGMGEVCRAKDTKLGRDVALKILPASFTNDPERIARFRREAQVLASLNHPHIAQIYGLEEANGTQFLVLELVDGESLDKRIAHGPIPVDEALGIAKQIAEALEAAHEKGIIHRDLKPANIALTKDGNVKVLDFGLAKATENAAGTSLDVTNSPTITTPAMMTGVGVILGTAAYMSPEQAKGRAADKRSDVWAFGCVLYEMVTGSRAFTGEDVSDTLASVLRSDPDWAVIPRQPEVLPGLVQGCLTKDRKARIGDMSTASFLLTHGNTAASFVVSQRASWSRGIGLVAIGLAIGTAIGAATTVVGLWRSRSAVAPVVRFTVSLPLGQQLALPRQAVAISPDGRQIAFVTEGRLYRRSIDDTELRPIAGGEAAISPVFSPDGQWLVFWSSADSSLKKIPASGGTPWTICAVATAPYGMSWDDDGILFAETGTGIKRVSANGGKPTVIVKLDSTSRSLLQSPRRLPGTDFVLFSRARRSENEFPWDQAEIVAQSLTTGEQRTIFTGGADARYVPTGHLVYAVSGTVFAVPFDVKRLATIGSSVPVIEGVERSNSVSAGSAHFAFSDSGTLVYVPGPAAIGGLPVALFDRHGTADTLKLPRGTYSYPRTSPDGTRLAIETRAGKETNVAIYDLAGTSSIRRLTFGGNNAFPLWTSDGSRIVFQSDRDGDPAIYWQPVEGGAAERLTTPERGTSHVPESWSPAGDTLLYSVVKGADISLWAFDVRQRKAAPFGGVTSVNYLTDATFSPDGRWVAYQVGEPNQGEAVTFVQPAPPNGTKYQIGRGGRPMWSRNGSELFYVPTPGQFVSVRVSARPTFAFSDPTPVPRGFGIADPAYPRPYDAMPDGRFVAIARSVAMSSVAASTMQFQVVLNWFDELKARVPVK